MDELKGKIQKLISQNKQKEALAAFIEWSREEEKAVLEGDLNMLEHVWPFPAPERR